MSTGKINSRGSVAPERLLIRVRALVSRVGVEAAAKQLGIAVQTLARLAAGAAVQNGTIALVQMRLPK